MARLLNSFSAGGRRFHTTKAMSDVHSDPGYYMDCFNGIHVFEFGRCLHCQHREVMLDLLLPKQSGPTTANG